MDLHKTGYPGLASCIKGSGNVLNKLYMNHYHLSITRHSAHILTLPPSNLVNVSVVFSHVSRVPIFDSVIVPGAFA